MMASVMRAGTVLSLILVTMGLSACDRVTELLSDSKPPTTVSATASASAVVPAGDWKPTKDFDGKWRVEASSGFRDGGFAFFPLIGTPVLIEGGVMAFVANATGGPQRSAARTISTSGQIKM